MIAQPVIENGKLNFVMRKPKPCNCGRTISGRVFPHRRDDMCLIYEQLGDDIESELKDDRVNAEYGRKFT